jgi:hypothetical protein
VETDGVERFVIARRTGARRSANSAPSPHSMVVATVISLADPGALAPLLRLLGSVRALAQLGCRDTPRPQAQYWYPESTVLVYALNAGAGDAHGSLAAMPPWRRGRLALAQTRARRSPRR